MADVINTKIYIIYNYDNIRNTLQRATNLVLSKTYFADMVIFCIKGINNLITSFKVKNLAHNKNIIFGTAKQVSA